MAGKRRFAQVGLGGRHEMFRDAVSVTYADQCEMTALCDVNAGRLQYSASELKRKAGYEVRTYLAKDFDRMIRETRPDCVIVTTKDCFHDAYICRAMQLGCDVITEKPMTTDERKCRRILETQRKTGRRCTVSFNYRYSPPRTQVKDILMSGAIGDILSVDFHWLLDTHHGADYYRRWHRNKANSGSLLVHKATHHFDLVNWWLSDVPVQVFAHGSRRYYTPTTAKRMGLTRRGKRCRVCPSSARCPFRFDLAKNAKIKAMYLDNETYDGYWRDQCVFNPENGKAFDPKVDIEDTMSVSVNYARGTILTYSLISYSPWEGYLITFTGTRGRLEHAICETSYVSGDGKTPGELIRQGSYVRVMPTRGRGISPALWEAKGGHGGADPVMLSYIFAPKKQKPDKYLRAADQRSGAYSILCGVAANQSILTRQPVRIADLVPGIEMPDYPPMPTGREPLAFPARS